MKIGMIQEIIRHPVKSMGGEVLTECEVTPYGLYGDRSCAFVFAGTEEAGETKYVSIQSFADMAAYRATLQDDVVTVTSPQGRVSPWDDAQLLEEIVAGVKQQPVVHKQFAFDQQNSNWEDPILITTDASLRAISEAWGKGNVDNRRFRSNIVVALDEDQPFAEDHWLGKEIVIGDVVLKAVAHCNRCSYLNVDPYDGTVDPSVLKTVVNHRENRFGMYCQVVKTGHIRQGDTVQVREVQA